MSEDSEYEEDLIRLSKIFETLKEDAVEVSKLLVGGIEYNKVVGYIAILMGILSFWFAGTFMPAENILQAIQVIIYFFLALVSIGCGIYGLYKYRRLKKKYTELIEIQKSLAEK